MSFGIMSHSGLCRLGLCRIQDYGACGITLFENCVVRVNVAQVYVVWEYAVRYTVLSVYPIFILSIYRIYQKNTEALKQ